MSFTRNTLIAAAAAIAITSFGPTLTSSPAEASFNNERLDTCVWYRKRAMASGRAGDLEKADHYWYLFRECMAYRID